MLLSERFAATAWLTYERSVFGERRLIFALPLSVLPDDVRQLVPVTMKGNLVLGHGRQMVTGSVMPRPFYDVQAASRLTAEWAAEDAEVRRRDDQERDVREKEQRHRYESSVEGQLATLRRKVAELEATGSGKK